MKRKGHSLARSLMDMTTIRKAHTSQGLETVLMCPIVCMLNRTCTCRFKSLAPVARPEPFDASQEVEVAH
eukprot:4926158-Amphidinium_carterae.1